MPEAFTVRVLLHTSDGALYEPLHAAMEKVGFTRTISGPDGVLFDLPHGEYNFETRATASAVRSVAVAAASTVSKNFQILVTPCSDDRVWYGLTKHAPRDPLLAELRRIVIREQEDREVGMWF